MDRFEILFNGEPKMVVSATVDGLLTELELSGKRIAVELNRKVVQREKYQSTPLAAGDCIEIVHFVGGG